MFNYRHHFAPSGTAPGHAPHRSNPQRHIALLRAAQLHAPSHYPEPRNNYPHHFDPPSATPHRQAKRQKTGNKINTKRTSANQLDKFRDAPRQTRLAPSGIDRDIPHHLPPPKTGWRRIRRSYIWRRCRGDDVSDGVGRSCNYLIHLFLLLVLDTANMF